MHHHLNQRSPHVRTAYHGKAEARSRFEHSRTTSPPNTPSGNAWRNPGVISIRMVCASPISRSLPRLPILEVLDLPDHAAGPPDERASALGWPLKNRTGNGAKNA